MRNQDYRPLPIPRQTCRRCPVNMPPRHATMNTSVWEHARFWLHWISMMATSLAGSSDVTGVASSSRCSKIWMLTIRQTAPFGSSSTIISAHISKETRAYLATRPNRFKYVLTPTHGSWLNIVETLFGKMARTFLRHIRVQSWEELRHRMLKGIEEINADPVVHRWKKFEALGAE